MFNITNYFDHPTRPGHTIFRFYKKERASAFQELLEKEDIWFECEDHEEDDKTTYFFGVKNGSIKAANRCNYLVNAQFRKPFITNTYLRWGVFVIAIIVLTLALIGYINQH